MNGLAPWRYSARHRRRCLHRCCPPRNRQPPAPPSPAGLRHFQRTRPRYYRSKSAPANLIGISGGQNLRKEVVKGRSSPSHSNPLNESDYDRMRWHYRQNPRDHRGRSFYYNAREQTSGGNRLECTEAPKRQRGPPRAAARQRRRRHVCPPPPPPSPPPPRLVPPVGPLPPVIEPSFRTSH